jgi:hypothetical protein
MKGRKLVGYGANKPNSLMYSENIKSTRLLKYNSESPPKKNTQDLNAASVCNGNMANLIS